MREESKLMPGFPPWVVASLAEPGNPGGQNPVDFSLSPPSPGQARIGEVVST